jgi:hypothetical protein
LIFCDFSRSGDRICAIFDDNHIIIRNETKVAVYLTACIAKNAMVVAKTEYEVGGGPASGGRLKMNNKKKHVIDVPPEKIVLVPGAERRVVIPKGKSSWHFGFA